VQALQQRVAELTEENEALRQQLAELRALNKAGAGG
jgi:ribosomal protein L29